MSKCLVCCGWLGGYSSIKLKENLVKRYQWLRLRMILNTNLVFFKWSCTPLLPLSDKGLWRIFQIWGFFLKKFIFTYLSIFELIKKVLYWISPYFLEVRNLDCFLPSWYSLILNTLSQCHCHCWRTEYFHNAVRGELSAGAIQLLLDIYLCHSCCLFYPQIVLEITIYKKAGPIPVGHSNCNVVKVTFWWQSLCFTFLLPSISAQWTLFKKRKGLQ